jgi:hypothetical protein
MMYQRGRRLCSEGLSVVSLPVIRPVADSLHKNPLYLRAGCHRIQSRTLHFTPDSLGVELKQAVSELLVSEEFLTGENWTDVRSDNPPLRRLELPIQRLSEPI